MNYEKLREMIKKHLPDKNESNFIQINFSDFDAGDDTMVAFVRRVNPNNDKEWSYEVYVLHDTNYPSLIYWKISRIYSDITDNLFNKIPL
jgi:hypothetical protein